MSLNYKEIDRIVSEIDLAGYFFRKVYPVDYNTFILEFYKKGDTKKILISADQNYFRFHLVKEKYDKLGASHNLTEYIKKYLINGVVQSVSQLGSNRIIEIKIKKSEETYRVLTRLWGGFMNIIITDRDYNILHLHKKSSIKEELPGFKFNQPPEKKQKDYTLKDVPDYNSYIENLYKNDLDTLNRERNEERVKQEVERLNREIRGLNRRRSRYERDLGKKDMGDLLTSNLYQLKGGESSITLTDWSGNMVEISLDPKLSPSENRDRIYKEYKKAYSGIEQLEKRISDIKKSITALENGEVNPGSIKKEVKNPNRVGLKYDYQGFEILVGRNGKENDKLLRSYVKGNDYWLHIRDYPGGYVFIKNRKGKSVPLEVLVYAGNLALYYSKGKNNGKGDLYYTQVKYLRKIKGEKLGKVIPTRSKNLYIKMDKNIILGL